MGFAYLPVLGLFLIAIGWMVQFAHMRKKRNEICKEFVGLYTIGIALAIVGGFAMNDLGVAAMNVACLIASLLVLYRLK